MRVHCRIFVALGFLFASSLGSVLFPENHQFLYHYKGHLRTGVTKPSHYGNLWEFEGHLHVQGGPDGQALFKLDDIHIGSYNGEMIKEEVHSPDPLVPVDAWVKEIFEKPWMAKFKDGMIIEVDLGPDTDKNIDLDNMKRQMASLFQIDLAKLNNEPLNVWESKEENAIGSCHTSFTAKKISPEEIVIKKFIDHSKCKNRLLRLDYGTSLPKDKCLPNKENLEKSSNTQRKYTLTHPKDDLTKLKLTGIESSSANLFLPFRQYGNAKYSYSTQKVKLESSSDKIENPIVFTPAKKTTLNFLPMKKTFFKIDEALKILDSILKSTSVNVEGPIDESVPEIYMLKRILRTATKEQLVEFFNAGTNKGAVYRYFLTSAYGLINTKAGVAAAVELYKDDVYRPLNHIVQTVEFPDESLLQHFSEEFLKDRETAIPFSILLGRICEEDGCKPETLEKYTSLYFKKFQAATEYNDQMKYIFALQNLRSPNLIELLKPVIQSHPKTNIRNYALDAVGHLSHTKEIYDLSLPLFINSSEPIEIRILAMKYLMHSRPTPSNLLQIYWYLDANNDSQVYSIFSQMIDEFSESHNPCLQTLKYATHYVEKFVKRQAPKRDWSENFIRSEYIDEDIGIMKTVGLFTMSTSNSYIPNMYIFGNQESALGFQTVNHVIIIKGEKIIETILDSSEDEVPTLQSVLDALKRVHVVLKTEREAYVDIIVKRFNRVVNSVHITAEQMEYESNTFLQHVFLHYSPESLEENFDWQLHIDNAAVSDLGTIVKNQIDYFKFSSDLMQRKVDVDMDKKIFSTDVVWKHKFTQYKYDTIKSLNPMKQQVHTVSNAFEDKFNIKLEGQLKYIMDEPNQQTFVEVKLINKKGDKISFNTHSETSSYLIDIKNYSKNNTVTYHQVPPSDGVDIDKSYFVLTDGDEFGFKILIDNENPDFFDTQIFDQILESYYHNFKFLGYTGAVHNLIPYLIQHRTMVNLADNINLSVNIEATKDSELHFKLRIPERTDDSHFGSSLVYRTMPENKEMFKLEMDVNSKPDLFKLNGKFVSEPEEIEITASSRFYHNFIDPYRFTLNGSLNEHKFSLEMTDKWNVQEKPDEIWPIEFCSELMNPVEWYDYRHEYNNACDKAWENQSYNVSLKINPFMEEAAIIESNDESRITIHLDDPRLKDTFRDILADIMEEYQYNNWGGDVECVANVNNVITWDGAQVNSTKPVACYHLLYADNNAKPQVAVWMKQEDPAKTVISLKIYSNGDLFELKHQGLDEFTLSNLTDSANKKEMPLDGIYESMQSQHIHGHMVIHLDNIVIATNGHYIYSMADYTLYHQLDGLCGTFDRDPLNDVLQSDTFKDCEF